MLFHAAIDLPVNGNECHPNPSHAVIDPANGNAFSTYLIQWCNCNDKEFDYSLELDAITNACKRMQQQWPMATIPFTPTSPSTATTPTQQSPMPLTQWYTCDNENLDFSLAIDKLIEACNCMQQWWLMVMITVAPPPPTTKPTPKWHQNSKLLDTLAYIEEFVDSDMDDWLDDQAPTRTVHQLPMSFHDMHVLQMHVMAKLTAMIGSLNRKIDLLTAATTCPPQHPLDSTTNAQIIPVPWLLLSCTPPAPQQHTVLRLLKPKGSLETLHASLLSTQLAPVSHTCIYKSIIPAKPPSIAAAIHWWCSNLSQFKFL